MTIEDERLGGRVEDDGVWGLAGSLAGATSAVEVAEALARRASAGHPAPILVRADGASAYLRGHPSPPIGLDGLRPKAPPAEHSLVLAPGDRLLMYTDGLFERRGVDLEIGLAHLMILTERTRPDRDAVEACELIVRDLLAGWHEDDACLLVADFTP